MTEQVIDIRDRIEKMRTQMTGSSNQANDRKKQTVESKNSPKNSIKIEKMETVEIQCKHVRRRFSVAMLVGVWKLRQ